MTRINLLSAADKQAVAADMQRRAKAVACTRAWQKAHPEKHRAHSKASHERHPETNRESAKRYRQTHSEKLRMDWARNRLLYTYRAYRSKAHRRGIDFAISETEFSGMVVLPCHYCGGTSSGLDRIDSDGGYTAENVVPCCWPCNRAKGTDSSEAYIARCLAVVSRHAKKE